MESSAEGCSTSRGHGGASSIDMRPTLCSWGANGHGQLGQDHTDDLLLPSTIKPELSPRDLQQMDVSCIGGGGGFSFIVTGNGHLLTCGSNDRGQLGHEEPSNQQKERTPFISVFTPCTFLARVKVTKAASGWDFMLALSDSGNVYSWGSNSFGQLGRPLDESGKTKQSSLPGEITFPSPGPQIDVAAGLRHSLSLSSEGCVFAWGHGKKGQLGTDVKMASGGKLFIGSPRKVPDTERVKSLCAGMYHSGAVDDTGNVYMWGCNAYGQCGISPETKTCVIAPTKQHIPCKDEDRVAVVCSGWTHLVARTDKGNLYSWGRSNLGQLGRQCGSGCDPLPALVEGLTRVTSHACGSEHNISLSESKVYTWGWNEHGICATGDEKDVPLPHLVTFSLSKDNKSKDSSKSVIHGVGCGTGHTFAIIQNTR